MGSSPITTSTPTRYQVYQWEIANRGTTIGAKTILASRKYGSGPNGETDFDLPVCSPLQGYGSGVVPGGYKCRSAKDFDGCDQLQCL